MAKWTNSVAYQGTFELFHGFQVDTLLNLLSRIHILSESMSKNSSKSANVCGVCSITYFLSKKCKKDIISFGKDSKEPMGLHWAMLAHCRLNE